MTGHAPFLELAAAAIDFELTPEERARLDRHLAECASCHRALRGFRADARAVAMTPVAALPPLRAEAIRGVLVDRRPVGHPLRLLAVAALVALLAVGSIVVGSELLRQAREEHRSDLAPVESVAPSSDPYASVALVTGWPTVGAGGVTLERVGGEVSSVDASYSVTVEVRGVAPGGSVELLGVGTYAVEWVCRAMSDVSGVLPATTGETRTEGSTTTTSAATVGADGTARVVIRLRTDPPVGACPDGYPDRGTTGGTWAIRIEDRAHGLALTPDELSWSE